MKYTLIDEKGPYALILRGERMTQYAVVSGLGKEAGSWDWTCCYYDFGTLSGMTKAEALFRALDYYLMRTNKKHIPWARMSEIATVLKDGLIEDGEEEAYRYMADAAEMSDTEAEYFGTSEWSGSWSPQPARCTAQPCMCLSMRSTRVSLNHPIRLRR